MVQMLQCLGGAQWLRRGLTLLFCIALIGLAGETAQAEGTNLSLNPSAYGPTIPSVESRAATRVTWNGDVDARWSNPANWDGGKVPGPLDIVRLTGSADTEIDAAFSGAVAGIVLAPDLTGTVRLARDLQVRGQVVIEGGTLVQSDHALTAGGWTQTSGQFVGGSAPLTITEAASVRGGLLVTPRGLMRVRSLDLQAPGVVRLGENGKLELTGEGNPLTGDGVLDTATNLPNSVESTGRATTDLLAARPLWGHGAGPAPLAIPAAAPAEALKLASGESNLRSAVIDRDGAFAYFGTSTSPGIVVKVRLSDFTRVGALKLASGEDKLYTGVVDPGNGFAYFGTYTSPGIIVKVRLSDLTRVGALKLNSGENLPRAPLIDPDAGYAYYGTFTSPGRVVQVRLSDLTRVRALTLPAGEELLFASAIDPGAGFAYFGARTTPGVIIKVRLSDLTRAAALHLNGEEFFHTAVIDPDGGYAYFGTYTATGLVLRLRLSDFTIVDTLTLNPGEGNLRTSLLDPTHGVIHFGAATLPGMVVSVRLSDFTRVGAVTLDPGQDQLRSVVIDPANQFLYFGTADSPGIVVKLPTVSETPPEPPGATVTFNPVADTHVNAANPSTNYGSATLLRLDASPIKRGYLRFDVSGLTAGVTRALLRLYASGSQGTGYTVRGVADNSWSENTITYSNAPALGAIIGTSGTGNADTWTAVDVTSYVTGNGAYSFALTTADAAGQSLASRESTNKPQLELTTGSEPPPPPPSPEPSPPPSPEPSPPPPGPGTNLLANAGFELDANTDTLPDAWSTWSHFARSDEVVRTGTFAGRFRAVNDSGDVIRQRVSNLTAGTTYNFSGWVNIPATTDTFSLKLQVRWLDSANDTISTTTLQTYTTPTVGWNETARSLMAPAGTAKADIRLVVASLNATVYVDDFSFGQ